MEATAKPGFTSENSARLLQVIANAKAAMEKLSEQDWANIPAPGKWSRKQVLGHLIDSAANNHLRFVRAQLCEKEFVSFSYEQNFYVEQQDYQGFKPEHLADLWFSYNRFLAHVIASVNPAKLDITCKIGPYEPAPLSFIITDYINHMEHHLEQILRQ